MYILDSTSLETISIVSPTLEYLTAFEIRFDITLKRRSESTAAYVLGETVVVIFNFFLFHLLSRSLTDSSISSFKLTVSILTL